MGGTTTSTTIRQDAPQDELLIAFARLMRKRYCTQVYLFGSRAKGTAHPESDYDVVAVSRVFNGQRRMARAADRYKLWYEAGGWGISLDLHCYTPDEFREELAGLGYLGQARRRRELMRVG